MVVEVNSFFSTIKILRWRGIKGQILKKKKITCVLCKEYLNEAVIGYRREEETWIQDKKRKEVKKERVKKTVYNNYSIYVCRVCFLFCCCCCFFGGGVLIESLKKKNRRKGKKENFFICVCVGGGTCVCIRICVMYFIYFSIFFFSDLIIFAKHSYYSIVHSDHSRGWPEGSLFDSYYTKV